MMNTFRSWGKRKFGNIMRELNKPCTQLEKLMNRNADREEIREVTDKMNELLYKEEVMWLQRSRITWLKEGDRNTKVFQSKAVWRARKNKIREIRDNDGVVHLDFPSMSSLIIEYFQSIFTADPSLDAIAMLGLFETKVMEEDNNRLCAAFLTRESQMLCSRLVL